jgi:hypothetical protein
MTAATGLQHQMQQLATAIRGDQSAPDNLLKLTPNGLPARLNIYSHAYRARLGEALKENFPILARVLGDDGFADLSNAFLDAYPSGTPSIRWFGERLIQFVRQHPDALPHPSLVDLVRMEWALNTAFDAADADTITVEDMMALAPDAWPDCRFTLHPSVRLLALDWNVEPLWTALTADENAETEPPEEFQHRLLIWRVDFQNQWRSVAADEANLLRAVIDGNSFTQLCDTATEFAGDNAAGLAAGYLRNWVESGLLSSIYTGYQS